MRVSQETLQLIHSVFFLSMAFLYAMHLGVPWMFAATIGLAVFHISLGLYNIAFYIRSAAITIWDIKKILEKKR